MKQITSILQPLENHYLTKIKEEEQKLNLIRDKINEIHDLTKNFTLPSANVVIKLNWNKTFKLCLYPRLRINKTHIDPIPSDEDFLKILDFLLKEIQ